MAKRQVSIIREIILITFVVLAFVMVYPMHKRLTQYAQTSAIKLKTQLEDQVGLKISYKKLSPSILSTLLISEVTVNNFNNEKILTIEKTKITFNLFRLLRGDFQKGFSSITIDGVDVDVDELVDFITYITQHFSSSQDNEEFDIESVTSAIPENIKVRNISVSYHNEDLTAEVLLKEINIDHNFKHSAFNLNLSSALSLSVNDIAKTFSCNLDASGTIFKNLDNSNLSLKLQNLTEGNYKVNKLSMLVTYADKMVDVQTIQSTNPISVEAQYNFDKQKAQARVRTQTFSPLNLITSLNSDAAKQLKLFQNFLIDTDTTASVDLSDLQKPDFQYKSKGYVYVPDEIFPKGVTVDYAVSGNQNKIDVEKLKVAGPDCNGSAHLSVIFKNLQASGVVELPYFVLPNGNTVSTEIYVDPLNKGFMAFSPQVFIGNKALTAIQLSVIPEQDSYDFVLEASDYSHFENSEPGEIKIDGSYLVKSQFLQASASLVSLFADSLMDFGIEAVPENVAPILENIKSYVKPFGISADAYFSTNFKTFSFNIPYVLAANTQGENQVLMVSANGNNDSIQLNQLSVVYGKMAASASGSLDINSETNDMFYTVDFNSSSIPYHFSGSIMKEIITLQGDYQTDGELRFVKDKNLNGHLMFENLPFTIDKQSFVATFDTSFAYDEENGPEVNINRLSLEALNSSHSISPKLNAEGNINKYGAQLTSISYTDFYSSLIGNADVTLNINDDIFNSAGLLLSLKNPLSDESVTLDATVSNPEMVPLNADTIKNSLYLSAQLQTKNLSLNRITTASNAANLLTGSLAASGTLEHPFVILTLDDASLLMGSSFLSIKGNATLEDKAVSVYDFKVSYAGMNFTNIQANVDLNNFNTNASCNFEMGSGNNTFVIPIQAELSQAVLGKNNIPESFVLNASTKEITGTIIRKPFSFGLTALYSNGGVTLFSTDNVGLTGNYYKEGILQARLKNDFASMDIFGNFDKDNTIISISDADINLGNLFKNINLDEFVTVERGSVLGNFAIKGNLDDPDFEGDIQIKNPVVTVPFIFDRQLSAESISVQGISNEIHVLKTVFKLNNQDKFQTGADLSFNKGALSHINVKLESYKKEQIPMNIKLPFLNANGDFTCNLDMDMDLDDKNLDLDGKVFCENLNVNSNFQSIANGNFGSDNADESNEDSVTFAMNLDCTLGTHASITFDPLLRCVFAPNTHVKIQIDSGAGIYNIDGQFNLKTGDIAYLNRNFYIKSGSIKLNPNDLSNPLITFNAETREKDDKNQNIKIILSAENQYLLNLKPKISSTPPKSELELQALLGQVVAADSDSQHPETLLFSAGDYAVQSLVLRDAENKLRDLLNFDIFSLRTNVVQNALNLSVNQNGFKNDYASNLLNNSTVYIGKYLGNSLYFDAMLQLNKNVQGTNKSNISSGGLVLQPEIGLELESPFGNIRWNYAPDIEALTKGQYVPSSSVTLMWKFSF